jgi:hypothetical protein
MATVTKVTPAGTSYLITNFWDEIAYQLICVRESIFGGVKSIVGDTIDAVISPVAKGITKVGKSLTSWIPIFLIVGAGIFAVYIFIIKKKV